jgi:hypothetical protein
MEFQTSLISLGSRFMGYTSKVTDVAIRWTEGMQHRDFMDTSWVATMKCEDYASRNTCSFVEPWTSLFVAKRVSASWFSLVVLECLRRRSISPMIVFVFADVFFANLIDPFGTFDEFFSPPPPLAGVLVLLAARLFVAVPFVFKTASCAVHFFISPSSNGKCKKDEKEKKDVEVKRLEDRIMVLETLFST